MISVDEALKLVLDNAQQTSAARMPALDAVGMVLAEEVVSDIDSPPHDKAMMDGYAVSSQDLAGDDVELDIIEEVTAGDVPTKTLSPGQATRIMTGAPIPAAAGAVVMIENTELLSAARVKIIDTRVPDNGNIMRRAESLARGQTVLSPGALLRPIEVGVLAEVGRTQVEVYRRPTVAVMTSGNELVTPDKIPAAGQIRNSNNAMLVALARRAGADVIDLGIARDEEEDIRRLVDEGLTHDVLVLSGGVSAGVLDLIPKVLAAAGVEQVFHKVNLKPGKPVWFGKTLARRASEGADDLNSRNPSLARRASVTLVFGLPGNPVSSLVCFELFARAAIARMMGRADTSLPMLRARLSSPHQQRGDRPVYFPAVVEQQGGRESFSPSTDAASAKSIGGEKDSRPLYVAPLPWRGSADLSTLAQANCFIHFPAGEYTVDAGECVDVAML